MHTGFPFNITVPYDNAEVGGGSQRPSMVAGQSLLPAGFKQTTAEWFNTSAVAPIPGTFGNLGRNALRQDGVQNVDFGMFKQTKLTEGMNIEFRAEFFNLFNTAFYGAAECFLWASRFALWAGFFGCQPQVHTVRIKARVLTFTRIAKGGRTRRDSGDPQKGTFRA